MILAYSYGLKTDLMFCTHDPADNNGFFYDDHSPDWIFISTYINAINNNSNAVKCIGQVELAPELILGVTDASGNYYWPGDITGNINWNTLTTQLSPWTDLAVNNWNYISDIWTRFKAINAKNYPVTFNIFCNKWQADNLGLGSGLTQSQMSTLPHFLINQFPGIASASIEFYMNPKLAGQNWLVPGTKWQAYRDTSLALLNAYNTGSIPSGKTRPPLFVSEFTLEPGTDGAFTWSKIDQEEYYHGILEAANLFSGNVSLSPFDAGVQTDRGELFESYNSENFPVPSAAWNWFCKYYNPSASAMQISIGWGGQIFGLGYGISGNQYPLLQWNTATDSWAPFHNGYGIRVAVDPTGTKPYVISNDFSLWQWNGSGSWTRIFPGKSAVEMTVGRNGSLYTIDLFRKIWKGTSQLPSPSPTPIKITTDYNGTLYTITSDNAVYYLNSSSQWVKWIAWLSNDCAFGSNGFFVLGNDWSANDDGYNLYDGTFSNPVGSGMQVMMDANNNPWVIKSNGTVWRRSGTNWVPATSYFDPSKWYRIASRANPSVCLDADNTGGVKAGNKIQVWSFTSGTNQNWKFLNNNNNYFQIASRANTSLEAQVATPANDGSKVSLGTAVKGATNQAWQFLFGDMGYFELFSQANTTEVIDVDNTGGVKAGSKVQVWTKVVSLPTGLGSLSRSRRYVFI